MSFQFSLTSTSTGGIFQSNYHATQVQGTVPRTPLPDSHPFQTLWRDHLAELTGTVLYESVIDALVALAEGSAMWSEEKADDVVSAKMSEMRKLLRQHPPNVVVVSGVAGVFAFHNRRTSLWPFICIAEEYVNMWVAAEKHSEQKLALVALLKTCLDHELGHWIFTQKFGCDSGKELNLNPIHKVRKDTWDVGLGEAGNFVEVRSRGGIMTYIEMVGKVMLRTGEKDSDYRVLPISYLKVYESDPSMKSSLRFRHPGLPKKCRGRKPVGRKCVRKDAVAKSDIFFPNEVDDLPKPLSSNTHTPSHLSLGTCEGRKRVHAVVQEILQRRRDEAH